MQDTKAKNKLLKLNQNCKTLGTVEKERERERVLTTKRKKQYMGRFQPTRKHKNKYNQKHKPRDRKPRNFCAQFLPLFFVPFLVVRVGARGTVPTPTQYPYQKNTNNTIL